MSPWTRRTSAGSTASSSATSSRNAVWLSCPTSTLPVKAVTVPDAATCSHAPPDRGHDPGRGRRPHHDEPVAQHAEPVPLSWRGHVPRPRGPRPAQAGPWLAVRGGLARRALVLAAGQGGGPVHRADDPRIAAAPAQAGVQRRGDLLVAGIGMRGQQRRGAQRDARRAVPALRRPLGDQRPLDRVQRLAAAPARPSIVVTERPATSPGSQLAGQHRPAVDEHRARAARTFAAALLDPGQAQLGSQERQQAPVRPADLARLGVDGSAAHVKAPPGVCRPLIQLGRIRIQNGRSSALTHGLTPSWPSRSTSSSSYTA